MKRLTAILIPVLIFVMSAAVYACPFCKDSIPTSDAQSPGNLPEGFNLSIYFMFAAFFCMLGLITLTVVKGARSCGQGRGFPVTSVQNSPASSTPPTDSSPDGIA